MSIHYNGVTVDTLKKLWPIIALNLPFEPNQYFDTRFNEDSAIHTSNLEAIVRVCCGHEPANFDEYVSYVMLATLFELLKFPLEHFHQHSAQLMAHTFNQNVKQWQHDNQKVLTVAEAIWKVSEDPSNVHHIIIEIQSLNQFTFNVSVVLLVAALGDEPKSVKWKNLPTSMLSLDRLDVMIDRIKRLDIFKSKNDRQMLFDFLCLFQTFQRMVKAPRLRDNSVKNVLKIQPKQLTHIKTHLQCVLLGLNKSISDQNEMNENATISYCIQLVLNNMDSLDISLF